MTDQELIELVAQFKKSQANDLTDGENFIISMFLEIALRLGEVEEEDQTKFEKFEEIMATLMGVILVVLITISAIYGILHFILETIR